MDFWSVVRGRRCVRSFLDKPVERDKVESILEAGFMAPSAGNLQAREFVVVQDKDKKSLLTDAALGQGFISEAPIVFVVCVNYDRIRRYGDRGCELYVYHDTGAAVENMLLAAYSLGLGSCWVGAFDEPSVSGCLGLPDYIRPVAIVPVGYSAEKPGVPSRRREVHWGCW